jgi:hypothetical protein
LKPLNYSFDEVFATSPLTGKRHKTNPHYDLSTLVGKKDFAFARPELSACCNLDELYSNPVSFIPSFSLLNGGTKSKEPEGTVQWIMFCEDHCSFN